jgi:hypothetical protein
MSHKSGLFTAQRRALQDVVAREPHEMNKTFTDVGVVVAIAAALVTNLFAAFVVTLYCDLTLALDGFEKAACDASVARTFQPLLPPLAVVVAAVWARRLNRPAVFYGVSIAAAGFGAGLALLLIAAEKA